MNIAVTTPLPALIDRASKALAGARTSAEILEARDQASVIYDLAKKTARLAKAKGAHDTLIAAAHRAQADALEIEAGAKRRLADEYDAAQERGEVARGRPKSIPGENTFQPTADDIAPGFSKDIHEARLIRDAEAADPGIVRRTLDEKLKHGEEPTKAALRQAVTDAAMRALRGGSSTSNKNPNYRPPSKASEAWTHLYGTARAFVEWATDDNIAFAITGLNERDDNQASNIRAVRECADLFKVIKGKINV
jgi:hypothetical protein